MLQTIEVQIDNKETKSGKAGKNAEFLNAGFSGRECSKKQKLKLIFLSF
jgi:hypothetical protein